MMIPELPSYLSAMGGSAYKGWIIALFTITAGISRPFSGKLADTVGRLPVMYIGTLACVICSTLYPVFGFVAGFLALRFFHGFSTGFKPTGTARGEFPGTRHLEQNHERGRLLHFFGNHELLATELMALVLLKFPDAPTAFRKGVLQTLKDEQEHTRLYMERMKTCGVELGDFPVSGYFWRCVAPMAHPIDYVARLCLTFEQANLDFAGFYGRNFAAVGDTGSAKLLEKIYRDEIGHVAYGLKWFRRWKNPGESDWEAFCHGQAAL